MVQVLDQAAKMAARYGMSHQLRSVEGIRTTIQGAGAPGDGDQGDSE
ncbi:hypothetical protein ACWGGS_36395 [Streptomyces decoyicus]